MKRREIRGRKMKRREIRGRLTRSVSGALSVSYRNTSPKRRLPHSASPRLHLVVRA